MALIYNKNYESVDSDTQERQRLTLGKVYIQEGRKWSPATENSG